MMIQLVIQKSPDRESKNANQNIQPCRASPETSAMCWAFLSARRSNSQSSCIGIIWSWSIQLPTTPRRHCLTSSTPSSDRKWRRCEDAITRKLSSTFWLRPVEADSLDTHEWISCFVWGSTPDLIKEFVSGWWFGCQVLFSHILEISSSQLTFIFFRGVAQPPTRYVWIVNLHVC